MPQPPIDDPVAAHRTRFAGSSFFGRPPQQIGLLVHDIHAAVRRYTDVLGIGPWVGYTYGPDTLTELRYRGEPGQYEMHIALSTMDPQVELIQPVRGPSIYHDWMAEHGEGLHHLAYPVPSIEEGIEELEGLGYGVIQYGAGYGPRATARSRTSTPPPTSPPSSSCASFPAYGARPSGRSRSPGTP